MDLATLAAPALPMTLAALARDSLGGDGVTMEPAMRLALDASFGSFEAWRADFGTLAGAADGAAGGAAGWALLVFEPQVGRLVNRHIADAAAAGDAAAGAPVMALDLRGPAAAAAPSVEAGLAAIDWAGVYRRYQHAVYAASAPHAAGPDAVPGALLIDVRRAGVYAQAATRIPGAQWRDPAAVAAWAAELPVDREVLVYCVYGHEVGRSTALRLRAAGVNARFLEGGIDGWQSAGRPVAAKAEPKEPA